jgi:hypothetical protein
MDPATEANPNGKRVRFNAAQNQQPTAIEKAKLPVSVSLASLPPPIKTLAIKYNSSFLQLRIDLRNLEATHSRLAKEDFIPHSARFKFDLNASDRVKEQASEPYKALVEQADVALLLFKSAAKKQIVRVVELEILTTKQAIAKLFCDATGILAIAFTIHHPTMMNYQAPALIYLVFDRHHQSLLEYSEIQPDSPQHYFNLLHEAHPVPSGLYESQTLEPHDIAAVEPAEERFKDLLDALFCRSWNAYCAAKTDTLRNLELQEFCEERLKEQATATVAMDLDAVTADSPELAKAVSDQVALSTKSLQAQVTRLTNKLNQLQESKNKPPGANQSSAQPKKKKDSPQQATARTKPKAAAQKAAAAANDSTASSKTKTRRGKGKKNNTKKSTPANSNS